MWRQCLFFLQQGIQRKFIFYTDYMASRVILKMKNTLSCLNTLSKKNHRTHTDLLTFKAYFNFNSIFKLIAGKRHESQPCSDPPALDTHQGLCLSWTFPGQNRLLLYHLSVKNKVQLPQPPRNPGLCIQLDLPSFGTDDCCKHQEALGCSEIFLPERNTSSAVCCLWAPSLCSGCSTDFDLLTVKVNKT